MIPPIAPIDRIRLVADRRHDKYRSILAPREEKPQPTFRQVLADVIAAHEIDETLDETDDTK